ncbi:MAG: DUF2304 domain-containing protein [Thermoleophilia bacterium]
MTKIQIFSLIVSLLLAVVIFQLIRKKKLKEQYSLLWFLTVAVMLLLSLWEGLLYRVSSLMGIAVPSNALFLLALLFMFVMSLHYSLLVSRLTDQSKMLAQRIAILDHDLRELNGSKNSPDKMEAKPGASSPGPLPPDLEKDSS